MHWQSLFSTMTSWRPPWSLHLQPPDEDCSKADDRSGYRTGGGRCSRKTSKQWLWRHRCLHVGCRARDAFMRGAQNGGGWRRDTLKHKWNWKWYIPRGTSSRRIQRRTCCSCSLFFIKHVLNIWRPQCNGTLTPLYDRTPSIRRLIPRQSLRSPPPREWSACLPLLEGICISRGFLLLKDSRTFVLCISLLNLQWVALDAE